MVEKKRLTPDAPNAGEEIPEAEENDVGDHGALAERLSRLEWPAVDPELRHRSLERFREMVGEDGRLDPPGDGDASPADESADGSEPSAARRGDDRR